MEIEDFFILKEKGNIGYYDYCDIVTIFLYAKKEKKYYNFFTMVSFCEGKNEEYFEKITPKLIQISKTVSLGIVKYSLKLEQVDSLYENLVKDNSWRYNNTELILDQLFKGDRKLVPIYGNPDGKFELSPINQLFVAYGDLFKCNYYIEFFTNKEAETLISKLLNQNDLKKACDHINKSKLHFDFNYLTDKIGNLIFKFTCNLFKDKAIQLNQTNGIVLELARHKKDDISRTFSLQIFQEFDGQLVFYESNINFCDGLIKIEPNDVLNKIIITDCKTNLIIFMFVMDLRYKNDYINCILPGGFFATGSVNFRTINMDGSEIKIQLSDIQPTGEICYWLDNMASLHRLYRNSISSLFREKLLLDYRENQQSQALADIREIIKGKGLNWDLEEICLWDPYLTSDDILATVYFNNSITLKVRAITSYSKAKTRYCKKSQDLSNFFSLQKGKLESGSNNCGVNLEFKCQHSQNGWMFHDRFLIFKHHLNHPRVWALGTSFNSIGKHHHIIQAVDNPQIIIDAFNELWIALPDEKCLICRINN